MSQPGKQSTAHEYNAHGQCIHCGSHRVNVLTMSLDCKRERERAQDQKDKEASRGK